MRVCPRLTCTNFCDEPYVPCAKHWLAMVPDTEFRRWFRRSSWRVRSIIEQLKARSAETTDAKSNNTGEEK